MKSTRYNSFFTSYEENYFRSTLFLAGLLYLAPYISGKNGHLLNFILPLYVVGISGILIGAISFFSQQIKARLPDLTAAYFAFASAFTIGLLSSHSELQEEIVIALVIIFFSNLQLTRVMHIVSYNLMMLIVVEYAFIGAGFGSSIHPVLFFIILILVIGTCAGFQYFRIRSAASGEKQNKLLNELVAGNPDAWIIFEGNGLIAREASDKAMQLLEYNDASQLSNLSLRNIITAGSPFEADQIISDILEQGKVEKRTLCRKPSGKLFWSELAVFEIPGSERDFFCRFFDVSEYLKSKEQANATAIRYRNYLDTVHEGILITDTGLNVTLANKTVSEMAGRIIKKQTHLSEFCDEDTVAALKSFVWEQEEAAEGIYSGKLKFPSGKALSYNAITELDPVDRVKELVLFIYEEVAATPTLTAGGEFSGVMQLMQEDTIPACAILDTGKFSYSNKSFAALTGYNPQDLGMLNIANLVHPGALEELNKLIHGGIRHLSELRIISGDGTDKYFRVTTAGTGISGQKIFLWEDITDLVATRKALEKSGSDVKAVIENTQSPVAAFDFNHKITFMNSAFVNEMYKRKGRNPIIGEDYRKLLNEVEIQHWDEMYAKVMSGSKYYEDSAINYEKGGKTWFESTYTPILLPGGAVAGMTLFMRDVTDRITFQNDLILARNQAEAATKAKSGFLATMSHEIRTPLNGLLGMTELMTGTSLSDEQSSYLDSIRISGEALLAIINDVLDYSKIESEMMVLEQKPFSIGAAIRETFDMLRYRATEKDNELQSHVNADVPDLITGDKVRLRQVLLNLTGNAIKFTEKGVIDISVSQLEKSGEEITLQFIVSDTGIGIPSDKIGKLFQSFTQADASTYAKYGGTGLGLSISARLVGLMGGNIRAESIEGKGSEFIFTVKTRKAAAIPQKVVVKSDNDVKSTKVSGINILVAEDNPVNQNVAKAMLRKMGHEVTIAANGKEAISLLQQGNYPIVFMDVQMPEMNGLEATKWIRAALPADKQPKIIAMTAQALEGDEQACLDAGMDDYMSKPVTASIFAEKIKKFRPAENENASLRAAADEALIDKSLIDRLKHIAEGDADFMKNIIRLFKDQSAETIQELYAAIQTQNLDAVWQAAHKIKGASLNLGAVVAGNICLEIENASKGGDAGKLPELYQKLAVSLNRSVEALEKIV